MRKQVEPVRSDGVVDLSGGQTRNLIVMVPGLGESGFGFEPLMHELAAETGRGILLIDSPRWGGERDPSGLYPLPLQRLANNIATRLQARGVSGATGIFHSMGGMTGLMAAHEHPELFERVVIVCGAGFVPEEQFMRLMRAVSRKSLQSMVSCLRHASQNVRWATLRGLIDGAVYIGANPWRAITEGRAVAQYSETGQLMQRVEEKGVEVYVVLARDDVLFALETVQQALAHLPRERLIVVDGVHDLQYDVEALVTALQKHNLI